MSKGVVLWTKRDLPWSERRAEIGVEGLEFAPAAAFFDDLRARKANRKDCSCVLKEGQTATFEIIPMGRTNAYGLMKVWDEKLQRYKWVDGGEEGKTPAYRRGNRYSASTSPSTPLRLR